MSCTQLAITMEDLEEGTTRPMLKMEGNGMTTTIVQCDLVQSQVFVDLVPTCSSTREMIDQSNEL